MSLGLIGCLTLLCGATFAESFVIDNYLVDMKVNDNGSLAITETIDVQFSQPRHGIERLLPQRYSYDDTRDEIVDYSDITSNVTKSTYTEWADLVLRLWDADRYVDGSQQYIISYAASPWVKQYSWWQELYWNLIGTEWWVPIRQVTFRVATPAGVDLTKLWSGDIQVVRWFWWATINTSHTVTSHEIMGQDVNLLSSEWITIGIKFSSNPFKDLRIAEVIPQNMSVNCFRKWRFSNICNAIEPLWNRVNNIDEWLISWIIIGIVWVFFVFRSILIYVIRKIKNHNRKKIAKQWSVIQYYPPKNFLPHEWALILDDWFEDRHFIATLYDWYYRWVIGIDSTDSDDVILHLKNKDLITWSTFEEWLVKWIFGSEDGCHINKLANWSFMIDEYYNTKSVNNFYRKWIITDKWVELYRYVIWYKEFIKTVESNQLIEYLKQDAQFINKLVPRAIALWLDKIIKKTLSPLIEQWLIPDNILKDNHNIKTNVHTMVLSQIAKRNSVTTSSHSRRSSFGSWWWRSRSSSWWWRWGGWGRSW